MAVLKTGLTFELSQVKWYNVIVLTVWHVGALYSLGRVVPMASYRQLAVLWLFLWWMSGLGITAGAHRLWSHRSYKATTPLRVFLMLCNSMAFQGNIFEWSRDHRVHHKGSETNADPHNASRGFFFSHMGWIMLRKRPEVISEGKKLKLGDLLSDPVVVFQMKYYIPTVLLMCYLFPIYLGYCMGSSWNGFWIGAILRHVWVLHMTWCVNSVAHFWGERPYDPKINPAENLLVSLGAIGEGWHNYHHRYPTDYATSEFGISRGQWNPTKLFIDLCARVGLAYDLKRSTTAKATREKVAQAARGESRDQLPSVFEDLTSQLFFGRSAEAAF